LYTTFIRNKPMSKFFTDCNDQNTFSLDNVVGVRKKDSYTTGTYVVPKFEILARGIVVTLLVGGENQKYSILFDADKEKERDAEFKRLTKALSKVTS